MGDENWAGGRKNTLAPRNVMMRGPLRGAGDRAARDGAVA